MRRCILIFLAFVFSWAFLRAPLEHIHEHDSASAHTGGLWHTHFRVAPLQGVRLEEASPSHDGRMDWFNQARSRVSAFHPNPVQAPIPAPNATVALVVPAVTPRAHDPPSTSPRVPRGPPIQ